MREHLRVRARPVDANFEAEIVEACLGEVQPVIDANSDKAGEEIIEAIAHMLGVHFEEVRDAKDINRLEQTYLVEQKELGFGQLAKELADPSVDALLFQRMNAQEAAHYRWIAILNLQQTAARAYWNRPHEIIHRVAEPPQKRLPLFRHRSDYENPVERLIDLGAAELAFPRTVYGDLVNERAGRSALDWDTIETLKEQFAPTASLQSIAKATVKFWPGPAFFLTASIQGRKRNPLEDIALRIHLDGFSLQGRLSGTMFYPNMRVPETSPIFHAHVLDRCVTEIEDLGRWSTKSGNRLPARRAISSGMKLGQVTYGLVSLI